MCAWMGISTDVCRMHRAGDVIVLEEAAYVDPGASCCVLAANRDARACNDVFDVSPRWIDKSALRQWPATDFFYETVAPLMYAPPACLAVP